MSLIRWVVGGFIGAAAGVAIWVLIGYFTGYEVGWIAWAVGFLVGVGVRYAAYLGGQEAGFGRGVLAALMAFGAVIVAKFFVFSLLVGGSDHDAVRNIVASFRTDDEAMIAGIADDVSREAMDRGQAIASPPGVSLDSASKKDDYPPRVWQEAVARWNRLGAKEQENRKLQARMIISELSSKVKKPDYGDFFAPWDLLWFGLAIVTAYKIGVGTHQSGD